LGLVDAEPSVPPSKTWIWPTSQIVLLPTATALGTTELIVVATEHVLPSVVSVDRPVAAQGMVTPIGASTIVPPSDAPLLRSVMRSVGLSCSSPE
jgi:hypothetical protein